MRTQIKDLAYGLTIGLILASAFMVILLIGTSGTAKSPIPAIFLGTETSTPTLNPSFIPTIPPPTITATLIETLTPSPTLTPTYTITPLSTATWTVAQQMILNGQIIVTGPLTPEQIIRLYETSVQFIAPSFRESKQIGEKINGVGYGSPTLICGPLSLAILQGAGLITNENLVPYDFWLLDPYVPKDRAILNRVFPKDRYQNILNKTSLRKFDWRSFPLQPGDFLFIRHGVGGNFDHMLVVNRVDNLLRAYAVTNYRSANGFIIDEVMLYDPNDPTAGMFRAWTEKQNAEAGSTGFGGFELWRLQSP